MASAATESVATTQGRPVVPPTGVLRPVGIAEVELTGGFWQGLQDLNATTIIDHAERWMERVGWIGNFDAAVEGRLPGGRQGREFSDSDVYKLMEAMAWEIGRTGSSALEGRFNALVDRIAPAQEPDGYLNTMYGRPRQQPRYSNLEWGHELYCYGHLIQAGIARARTAGEDRFVDIVRRAADHVCAAFGADGLDGIGGHPEIEMALAEFGRLTGEPRYLDQAQRFVERRGHGRLARVDFGQAYFQDDIPVRDAEVLRGHAVRALYLAAGAVDVAVDTGDQELLAAVGRQLAATLARRTYLTGGMGARHDGESFGDDYQLPPDRAYSETCAGVATAMLAHRLLLATGEAVHADLVERVLFNVVATSIREDGRAFFYANTLYQRTPGTVPADDEVSARATANLRAPWFAVSCCPTNVARLLASLGAYLTTVDDAGLQIHQYAAADIRTVLPTGDAVAVRVRTDYPWHGRIEVEILESPERPWALSLRVPGWADEGAMLVVDGRKEQVRPGYTRVERAFTPGEVVELHVPIRARWTWPDPRVDAIRGQVAVERGPVVMCLESTDLGADVTIAQIHVQDDPVERDGDVLVPVQTLDLDEWPWPYRSGDPDLTEGGETRLVPLVPYHRWANRGPSTMRVWMPVAGP